MNHSHVLYDSDPHFRIDPISRNIINTSSTKTRLIQHDHNSERFTFEIPRHIEGHDMVECNLVEIHYSITEANTKIVRGGVYTVDDLQEKDENTVVCSWLVPSNATQFVGQLQFLIRFSCVNESTGKLEYVWNTSIYNAITISSGIYNFDSPSDNTPPPFNFVTTVSGQILKFFVGTQAEYEELRASGNLLDDCIYYITDDTTAEGIDAQLKSITDTLNGIIDGVQVVPKAENANRAENAEKADEANHANQADEALEAESAKKATVLMPTVLQSNSQGGIPITESGVYIVCIQERSLTDYTINFLTDMIAVANLYSSSVSIKGSGGVTYDKSTKSLTVGGSTAYREYTIAFAYRLC